MSKRASLPLVVLMLIVLLSVSALPISAESAPPMQGFTADKAAWELQYESLLKAIPDPNVAHDLSVALTDHSTLVGSDWDKWNVEYSVNWLKQQGLEPEVKTYYPYISIPKKIQVDMVKPTLQALKTKENPWPWQNNFDTIVEGYNAYSPAGDVTGQVVYVNYGVPEDYAKLAEMGISVEGKIAIARYGISFRGVKTKVAAEHGAKGLLIYSDPADDGFVRGYKGALPAFPAYPTYPYGVYPSGPWRAPDGIQRGSILYIFDYVGDPLTPGWAATEKAPRLNPSQATNLPRNVPTTAIGYGEAAKLLEQLDGPVAPDAWQGGLSDPKWADFGGTPFKYHMGGTDKTQARMNLDIDYQIQPMWDIIVTIPGKVHPEQTVVVGTHRDGWAYGTADSTSGYIVVLQIAKALKLLMNQGWQPDRTIILAGWDGEEYGLLGSTEWVEEFSQQLGKNCVGYINLDGAGGGQYFGAAGVPSLDQLVYDVTKQVEEPRTPGKSVYEDWVARANNNPTPGIGRMGGGSDYQAFLQFIGVPSISLGFGGTGGGNYHSTTDDLYYMDHWGDPGYKHYAAMSRLAGIAALRLANADILPFVYSKYAGAVAGYLDQLKAKYPQADLNFDREKAQAEAWQQASLRLEGKIDTLLTQNQSIPPRLAGQVDFINAKLIREERDLTQPKGVPGRTWYKHMIYTPGLYTGYAVQYLAPLEDSITGEEWAKVNNYKALLHNSLTKATNTASTAATAK